jgi:hypothetical protein
MTKSLNISPDLDPLPPAAVTQKFAALGISGSGKTYGIGKFVETLLDAGAQVVIVDTVGNWGQGLRLAADGKKPGIAIPILGGEHGDVPLDVTHGKLAATTVVETRSSLVLDVSDFAKAELARFVPDFAIELLALKKRNKSPVMIVWEECQDVVPQGVRGDVARMVGAVEKLVKKGRNYGVGTVLISQRAAAVNKDVLNQVETLFAFRQNSKHDRAAVRDWVVSQSIDIKGLTEQLPTLKTGECFCWSPSWLEVLKKIKFGKKRTFDASKTPDMTDYVKPGALAPVDLEAFTTTMRDAIERAKADDPKELRRQLAAVQAELVALRKQPLTTAPPKVERIEVPVFHETSFDGMFANVLGQLDGLQQTVAAAKELVRREMVDWREGMRTDIKERRAAPTSFHPAPVTKPIPATPQAKPAPTSRQSQTVTSGAGQSLGKCARAILTALVQHGRPSLTLVQAAIIAGYSSDSGGVRNAAGELRSGGFVAGSNDSLEPLPAGRSAVADAPTLPTGAALAEYWYGKLGRAESYILKVVVDAYPDPVALTSAAAKCGYEPNSGGVRNAAGKLRTLNLVFGGNGGMLASERLVR